MTSSRPRAVAAKVDAADDRSRVVARLAEHELGRARKLVGDGDLRRLQLVARAVVRSRAGRAAVAGRRPRGRRRSSPGGTDGRTSRSRSRRRPGRCAPAALSRMRAAEASGSSGSSTTVPAPFAFDASTPADAQTKPCRVSAITSGGRDRTTRTLSRRISSRWRGIGVGRQLAGLRRTARRRPATRRGPPPSKRPSARPRPRLHRGARPPARRRRRGARRGRRPPRSPAGPRAGRPGARRHSSPVTRRPACAL